MERTYTYPRGLHVTGKHGENTGKKGYFGKEGHVSESLVKMFINRYDSARPEIQHVGKTKMIQHVGKHGDSARVETRRFRT